MGAYSVLNSSPYKYTIKAKGNVQVLKLEALALYAAGNQMGEINDAIDSATEYILENEVPICDYTCAPQNLGKPTKSQSVRVTNKRNL